MWVHRIAKEVEVDDPHRRDLSSQSSTSCRVIVRLGCRDRVTGVEDDAPLVGGGRSELLEERLLRSGGGQIVDLPFHHQVPAVGVVMCAAESSRRSLPAASRR